MMAFRPCPHHNPCNLEIFSCRGLFVFPHRGNRVFFPVFQDCFQLADVCPPHSEFCHAHKTLSPLPADLLMFSSLLSSLTIKNAEVKH